MQALQLGLFFIAAIMAVVVHRRQRDTHSQQPSHTDDDPRVKASASGQWLSASELRTPPDAIGIFYVKRKASLLKAT
jgi:hypothetical protein